MAYVAYVPHALAGAYPAYVPFATPAYPGYVDHALAMPYPAGYGSTPHWSIRLI